jgi:hypothetical protein
MTALGLSTNQLKMPHERSRFLEVLAAHLNGNVYPTDAELAQATQRALETMTFPENIVTFAKK